MYRAYSVFNFSVVSGIALTSQFFHLSVKIVLFVHSCGGRLAEIGPDEFDNNSSKGVSDVDVWGLLGSVGEV